ncbi:MAG: 4-hydroxy-tetrahydrodipicolinate synthase [Oscillospiraceae bacterium]|nr:4-hydroxy-tetrahydrodipicolinate synthase [Oscillospiraceae bacterium]
MKEPLFTGSAVAIVTPFRNDDLVDYDKLGELIDYQIDNGTSAIIICGTTGEASTLTTPEHLCAIEFAVKRTGKRVPVIAGTGSNNTSHAVEMSKYAEESGADGLLIVTPYYNKTSPHGLLAHYKYIADRVGIPIILYNVPSRTGMSFTASAYAELANHPNIIGVKEASGDFNLLAEAKAVCPDDFYIWSGNDDTVVRLISMGGIGVISVAANIIPGEMAKMCRLCLEGDFKKSEEIQEKYLDLINALFIEVNPVPVKTAMNLMGMNVGHFRMPLCDMTHEHTERLKKELGNAGLL